MVYGEANSVPSKVSREHCIITISNNNSEYTVSNANPKNITFVNGTEIEQKRFNPQSDKITLSSVEYRLDVIAILNAIMPQTPPPPKELSIKHLKEIWHENHENKLKFQIKQQKVNAIRSGTGLLTMVAMILGLTNGRTAEEGDVSWNLVLYGIAFSVSLFFFIKSYKSSSENPRYLDKIDKKFRKDYVCPNADCHRFLGYHQPYDELVAGGACPYCKSKFTDK